MARRGLLRELLRSGVGRARAWRMALVLGVLGHLSCVVTFPLDFGPTRWSNPAVWADYPKAVPPAWTQPARAATGRSTASWRRPSRAEIGQARRRPSCAPTRCPSSYAEDEPPTFLSFRLGAGDATAAGRPRLSVVLVRPDGTEVPLLPGRRPRARGRARQPPYVRNADDARCGCC